MIPIPELTESKNASSHGAISYMSTFNVDGNLSLSEDQHAFFWNPHMVGSPNAEYSITFSSETVVYVKNVAREKGYIAAGAWFDRAFIPLGRKVPIERDIYIEFDAMLEFADHEPNEWFRIAVANKLFKPSDSSVHYLELDFWDSPHTYEGPVGGIVYQDESITKLHEDQISTGFWKGYRFNLYEVIKNLTKSRLGTDYPRPESFYQLIATYIVIEYDKAIIEAKIHIKNLKLSKSLEPKLPTPYDETSLLNYVRTFVPADISVARAPYNPPPLTNALPHITISGEQLLANGTPLVLRGGGDDYKSILESDWIFNQIVEYPKFNFIRLSFRMISSLDSPHTNINFTIMNQILAKLEANGIYAVLDAHHYWLPLIYEDLWTQQWVEIAKYYQNASVIAAYELCNEPFYNYRDWTKQWLDWNLMEDWKTNRTAYAYIHAREAIEKVDPNRLVIFNLQLVNPEMMPKLLSPNVILAFHSWTGRNQTFDHLKKYAYNYAFRMVASQNASNIPIWLGEYGIYWDRDIAVQDWWVRYWSDVAKANSWGYCFWMLLDSRYYPYWNYLFE